LLDGEAEGDRDLEGVGRRGPAGCSGGRGQVKGEKRNGRVTAFTRCRLACMMRWDCKAMTDAHPTGADRISAVIDRRED